MILRNFSIFLCLWGLVNITVMRDKIRWFQNGRSGSRITQYSAKVQQTEIHPKFHSSLGFQGLVCNSVFLILLHTFSIWKQINSSGKTRGLKEFSNQCKEWVQKDENLKNCRVIHLHLTLENGTYLDAAKEPIIFYRKDEKNNLSNGDIFLFWHVLSVWWIESFFFFLQKLADRAQKELFAQNTVQHILVARIIKRIINLKNIGSLADRDLSGISVQKVLTMISSRFKEKCLFILSFDEYQNTVVSDEVDANQLSFFLSYR